MPHYVLCVACGTWHRAWSRSGNTFGTTTLWSDGRVTSTMLPAPEPVVACCATCKTYFWIDAAPQHSASRDEVPPPTTLVVTDAGAERLRVIQTLRGLTGVSIAEARAIVDERRAIDTSHHPDRTAGEMQRALVAAGARVEMRDPRAAARPWMPSNAPDIEDPYESRYLDALDAGTADTPERERTLRTLTWWLGNDRFRGTGRRWVDLEARAPRVRENVERLFAMLDPDEPQAQLARIECARQLGRFDVALSLVNPPFPIELQRTAGVLWALAQRGDRCLAEVSTRR